MYRFESSLQKDIQYIHSPCVICLWKVEPPHELLASKIHLKLNRLKSSTHTCLLSIKWAYTPKIFLFIINKSYFSFLVQYQNRVVFYVFSVSVSEICTYIHWYTVLMYPLSSSLYRSGFGKINQQVVHSIFHFIILYSVLISISSFLPPSPCNLPPPPPTYRTLSHSFIFNKL